MGQCCFTVEDEFGRTGHIDVFIAGAPFDLQRAAIHHDLALASCAFIKTCSNGCGTCSRTASLRNAAASFPDTGADSSVSLYTGKLNIATLRKSRMTFQCRTCCPDLIHVVS